MQNIIMIFYGLISLAYILILSITITGFLKLALKENPNLQAVHKYIVPPAIALWVLVMYGAIFAFPSKPMVLSLLLTLFLCLVFAGALTGWMVKPGLRRIAHMLLGAGTFVFFTYFIFGVMLGGN